MNPGSNKADEPLTPSERQFLIESGMPRDSFDPARKLSARRSLVAHAEETRRNASRELSVHEVAALLGCSAPRVIEMSSSMDLYSFTSANGLRFPEWQFPDGRQLPQLRKVLREVGPDMHPYSVEGLLAVVSHEELGDQTAVDWLRAGGPIEPVVSLAVSNSYGM